MVKGKDIFFWALTGAVLYIGYRVFKFGEPVGEAVSKFWEGLTFDPATLGPAAQLTPAAQQAQADWIAKGYLEIRPDGSTRITSAGETYIRSQREKEIKGTVL